MPFFSAAGAFGAGCRVSSFDPLTLNPVGDYLAQAADLTLSGTDVTAWADRSAFNSDVSTSAPYPAYQATGWNGTSPDVNFTGSPFLQALAGTPIISAFNGTNHAFTFLARIQFNTIGDQVICAWSHSTGTAQLLFRIDNSGTGLLRIQRQSDSGASAQVTGAVSLGTGRITVGVVSDGQTVGLAVNSSPDAIGSIGSHTCTFDRFRIGTGPGALDALDAKLKHLHIATRQYTSGEYLQYHAWASSTYP